MRDIKDHRKRILEICDFAFKHGINELTADEFKRNMKSDEWEESIKDKFIKYCHIGFAKAQDLLITEVLYYQKEYRQTKAGIKDLNRDGDKVKVSESKLKLEEIKHRLYCFMHIANGIAWQLIGAEIHIARRLFIGQDSFNFLDSSNIEHSKRVAGQINRDYKKFALISDLTGFIQIGDLLIKSEKGLGILELKEGIINKKIDDIFNKIEAGQDDEIEKDLDKKTIRQMERRLRQEERVVRAVEVINKDEGIDPRSGKPIKIIEPKYFTEHYHKELVNLEKELKENKAVYDTIEGCLIVGMFKGESREVGRYILKKALEEETQNYLIIDFATIIGAVSEPLFAKGFSPDFIVDVLTGKVKVFMGLEGDSFVELLQHLKVECKWMSKKSTSKSKESSKDIVSFNGHGLLLRFPDGTESYLLSGLMSKIFFDSVKPSSIINSLIHNNKVSNSKD